MDENWTLCPLVLVILGVNLGIERWRILTEGAFCTSQVLRATHSMLPAAISSDTQVLLDVQC